MAKKRNGKRKNTGLNKRGRIDWSDRHNLSAAMLAEHGLHGAAIARHTGLSLGAVYYRNKRCGIKLRDYRDGKSGPAVMLIRGFAVKNMTVKTEHEAKMALKNTLPFEPEK
jgi:hypothetical protein